jgi:hypothetical protein
MNGLPEGFVIDQPAVAPPEGFVIDQGGASSMGGRPPQVDAYQPGKAWNEQPFSYRTQWEQKAEDELSGKGSGLFGIAEAVYGRKQQHTAADVQARAEEMAKASGYAPSFGDWERKKAPDRRTIMNAGNPGMMIESRGVWEPKTFAQDGEELIDLKRPKMGAVEAGAKGAVDIAMMTPGVKSIASTLATPETNPYREGFGQTKTAADLGRDWDAEAKRALEDQPLAFMGGQAVSLLAGGQGALYEKGVQVAPRLIAPSIAAKAGPAAKFIGRVAAHSGVGALDYAVYEGIAGANNDARLKGGTSADVTLGDRAGKFGEAMTNPLSYAFGPATLAVSRLGNGLVNSGKNSVRASIEAGGPRLRGGDMTPRRVQEAQRAPHKSMGEAYTAGLERVLADNPNPQLLTALENTPFLKKMVTLRQDGSPLPEGMTQDYVDAIKHALKRGLNPDQIEAVMKAYHYGGYGSVDEALGLLSNSSKVKGLNVALSNIPGDAQEAWRDFFQAYREGSPEVVQRLLSRATGVDANDYAGFVKDLERKKVSKASPLYEASAGRTVAPETWDNQILPAILKFDGAPTTIREAAGEVASGQHPGSLEAARELHKLANQIEAINKQATDAGFAGGLLPTGDIAQLSQQVGRAVERPEQVSTRALIELDKFLGRRAKSISKDRPDLAGKYSNTSAELRGTGRTSGLDPETKYNEGRAVSRSYKTAIEAAEAGSKAFANGKTLRTLVDDIKLQIDGEMDELGKASLLMGWMRSAEDAIESSGGSAQVVNRLYGTANQRKKMLAMIPEPKTSDQTKRVQALTGQPKRKLDGKPAPVKSIFDRQRAVLNAEKGMTGGSPSAPKLASIFGESEVTRFVDGVLDLVGNPVNTAKSAARSVVHTFAKPPIYKEGVNRELGNIMTTTGKQGIEKRLADIRKVQGMNAPRGGRAPNALAPRGPVRGAGWTGQRPHGFKDEMPRGTERFEDSRLKPDQNKRVEMGRNGYSNAEIGEEFGMSENAVSVEFTNIRRDLGVDIPHGRTGREPSTSIDILRLAEKGVGPKVIGERLGIDPTQARVTLNRARKALRDAGQDLPDWLKPQSGRPSGAGILEGAKGDLASGAVGSAYGYTQGDTPEEKNANAVMGMMSGIALKQGGQRLLRGSQAGSKVRGAGFIGNTPKRGAKRLGRGLDDLTNEPGPAKPARPDDLPRRTVEPPAQGRPDPTLSRERTSKDDKAFYDSLSAPERDHARAVGPIGKMGKEPPPPGFVVTASLLTALGGAGGVSAYLGSRPVEPNFAQNRSKVMSELAKAPDSATWQNRARQFDAFVKSDTARQTDLEGVDKRLLNARRKAVREASDAFATAGDRAELTAAIDRVEALDYAIDVSLGNAEPFDEAPPMARPPSLKPVPNALAGPPPMTRNSQGQFVRPMTNRERQEAAR